MIETNIHTATLPNGVRIVHKEEASQVAYCGFAINAGTRDEEADESGMAHFIEHMLFKGTVKRNSWHILNRLEGVGGEINAYTTKEETFVYSTVLTADFEKAVDLCSDIVFHPTFPAHEIEKEVDVIIEEINSYNDSPSELIYDEFESIVFKNSQLGRNILGDAERLQEYTTENALRFVANNYFTDRILFFSVGNIPFKKVMRLAEKYFGDVAAKYSTKTREKSAVYVPDHIRKNLNTHQTHALIGARAYSLSDERRLPLYLLNNILGGPGMNSKLNLAVREKRGLAYSVESAYTAYSDDGLVNIYFGTEHEDTEKCLNVIYKELKNLRDKEMPSSQLERAKKQLMGQLAIAKENRENSALSMAKSFLFFGMDESNAVVAEKISKITSQQLLEIANEIFEEDKLSTLIYTK